jgi:hypothetical protein
MTDVNDHETPQVCAICLDSLANGRVLFEMSCHHSYHLECIKGQVCQKGHSFIDCALCRVQNTHQLYVDKTPKGAKEFIDTWFHRPKRSRCSQITKKGTRCKKHAAFLNNGLCHIHRQPLPVERYMLFAEFTNRAFGNNLRWSIKMYMIDFAKQLLLHYPDIQKCTDIDHYLSKYYHHRRNTLELPNNYQSLNIHPNELYKYYEIPLPPSTWIDACVQGRTIW